MCFCLIGVGNKNSCSALHSARQVDDGDFTHRSLMGGLGGFFLGGGGGGGGGGSPNYVKVITLSH